MKLNEEYDANDKIWYCGRTGHLDKFYKPTINNQLFLTRNPKYAMSYMKKNGNIKDSRCIVCTVNRYKLKIFDFTDINDINKLNYPDEAKKILHGIDSSNIDSNKCFEYAMHELYDECIYNRNASDALVIWFKNKFMQLIKSNKNPGNSDDELYEYQAVVLSDIEKLPQKYNAYYDYEGDGQFEGESIVLFNVNGMDKVIPVELSYDDMKDLVDEIDSGSIDKDNIMQIKDFIVACTGAKYDSI